jgi:hypothetical protein
MMTEIGTTMMFMAPANDPVERPAKMQPRTGERAIQGEHGAATDDSRTAPTCC